MPATLTVHFLIWPWLCHRHPRSPVSVSAVAEMKGVKKEMEGVRLIKVPFPQKEAKLARLCHIPMEGLRRGSQTISPGEPKIHNFHDCSLKGKKKGNSGKGFIEYSPSYETP